MISFDIPPFGTFDAMFHTLDAGSQDLIGRLRRQLPAISPGNNAGVVVGGLCGCALFQWSHARLQSVPKSLLGKGIDSALMAMAETKARKRGCIGAYGRSFRFQAASLSKKPDDARLAD